MKIQEPEVKEKSKMVKINLKNNDEDIEKLRKIVDLEKKNQ